MCIAANGDEKENVISYSSAGLVFIAELPLFVDTGKVDV